MKSVYRNSIFNMLKVLSTLIFPLISYTYVTHILQVDSIGKVEFARSFTSYFVMLGVLGIVSYATREASRLRSNKRELSKFTHEILFINFLAVLFSLVCLLILTFVLPQLEQYKVLLLINSISVVFISLGFEWLFAAMEEYSYIAIRTIVIQILSMLLILIVVREKSDINKYAFLQVLSLALPNILNMMYSRKYVDWKYFGQYNIRRHLKSVVFLFLMTVSVQIFSSLDTTMLGFMSGNVSVGLYTAATKMINIVSSLLVAIISVLTPRLSIMVHDKNFYKLKTVSYRAITIIFLLSIPAAVGLTLLSKELILIFSGYSFISGNLAAKILAARVILSPLNTYFIVQLFISMGLEKNNLITTSVAALINIILNFVLIPLFLQNGAAIATVIAEVIELAFNAYFARKLLSQKKIFQLFCHYLWPSLIIVLLWFILQLFVSGMLLMILLIPLSVILYFIILYLLKDEVISETVGMIKKRLN